MTLTLPATHSSVEDRYPDEAEAALGYEQNRQARHLQRHGSLDAFTPAREFPCLGVVRVVDRHGPQWTAECDRCGWATTVRSPERAPKERTLDEAAW